MIATDDPQGQLAHRVGEIRIGGGASQEARDLGEVVQQPPRPVESLGTGSRSPSWKDQLGNVTKDEFARL
ncbi:hypothetical protein GCM10009845_29040 [Pedococcus bigeumensis]